MAARTSAATCAGRSTPGAGWTSTVVGCTTTGGGPPADGAASGSAARATDIITVRLPNKPRMMLLIDALTMVGGSVPWTIAQARREKRTSMFSRIGAGAVS